MLMRYLLNANTNKKWQLDKTINFYIKKISKVHKLQQDQFLFHPSKCKFRFNFIANHPKIACRSNMMGLEVMNCDREYNLIKNKIYSDIDVLSQQLSLYVEIK